MHVCARVCVCVYMCCVCICVYMYVCVVHACVIVCVSVCEVFGDCDCVVQSMWGKKKLLYGYELRCG